MDSEKQQSISVRIFRETFTIYGKEDPEEMARLAEIVDRKMREIAEKLPHVAYQRIAVLTALNLAAELHAQGDRKESLTDELEHLDKTSMELLCLLDPDAASAATEESERSDDLS